MRRGNTLQLAEVPTELTCSGGLCIELSFVGVCGTDLQILNGSRPDTAHVLGHEGVGTVMAAGPGANVALGERVVFNPAAQLASGLILGHNSPGLFQRRITVSSDAVEAGLVLPLRRDIPELCGALVEPLSTVIYGHELILGRVASLRAAVIFGAGTIGLLAASYLGSLGVRVVLVHTNPVRIDTAVALGIVQPTSILLAGANLSERILALNQGLRLDAALVCTTRSGAPLALRSAVDVVRQGGCIDMVTNYPEEADAPPGIEAHEIRAVRAENVNGLPLSGQYLAYGGMTITGHRGASRRHLESAMQALSSDIPAYTKLITHVLPLSGAATAIEVLAGQRSRILNGRDCVKLVIDMSICRTCPR